MSWICDNCSTANEDHTTECFVCGEARSAESILAAKRAEREARANRRRMRVYKCATMIGKVLCFSSIVLFSVTAMIVLFLKMRDGSVGDIVYTGIRVVENFVDHFKDLFCIHMVSLFSQLRDSPVKHLGGNFVEVFSRMGRSLSEGIGGIGNELFVSRAEKFENLSQMTAAVKNQIFGTLDSRGAVISHLLSHMGDRIAVVVNNGIAIIRSAKDAVLQFKR